MITAKVLGYSLSFRQPTLDEIADYRKNDGMESLRVSRKLVEACGDASEVLKAKPALALKLGLAILRASGMAGPLDELDESELDEEMAAAWVEAQGKGFESLHAFRYEANGASHRLICREPRELELDTFTRDELAARAAQSLVAQCCVWCDRPGASKPNVLAIEKTAPGLYVPIATALYKCAGLTAEIELGE